MNLSQLNKIVIQSSAIKYRNLNQKAITRNLTNNGTEHTKWIKLHCVKCFIVLHAVSMELVKSEKLFIIQVRW